MRLWNVHIFGRRLTTGCAIYFESPFTNHNEFEWKSVVLCCVKVVKLNRSVNRQPKTEEENVKNKWKWGFPPSNPTLGSIVASNVSNWRKNLQLQIHRLSVNSSANFLFVLFVNFLFRCELLILDLIFLRWNLFGNRPFFTVIFSWNSNLIQIVVEKHVKRVKCDEKSATSATTERNALKLCYSCGWWTTDWYKMIRNWENRLHCYMCRATSFTFASCFCLLATVNMPNS